MPSLTSSQDPEGSDPTVRILFAGSDDFSQAIAERLLAAGENIVAVLTAPDKPRGRSLSVRPLPFAEAMERRGLQVLKLPTLRTPSAVEAIMATGSDVFVLASYGRIIPPSVLELFKGKTLNVHPSVLPKYRGAAPVQRALMDGVSESGVTIIRVTEKVDAGPILAARKFEIGPDERAGEVLRRASVIGASLLLELLARLRNGVPIEERAQNESEATYAPRLEPHESVINWKQPAIQIHNLVRALHPQPLAYTRYKGERLRILRTALPGDDLFPDLSPGALRMRSGKVFVGTQSHALELQEVQREGRNAMSAREWALGARLTDDARFEF